MGLGEGITRIGNQVVAGEGSRRHSISLQKYKRARVDFFRVFPPYMGEADLQRSGTVLWRLVRSPIWLSSLLKVPAYQFFIIPSIQTSIRKGHVCPAWPR